MVCGWRRHCLRGVGFSEDRRRNMTTADFVRAAAPAAPIFIVAFLIFLHARKRWSGRFDRGNRRPAVACTLCGRKYQRGLPLQFHMDQEHNKKGKRK